MFRLSHVLFNPKKAERHPFEMLMVGFFYASISLFLSLWIFPDYSSLVMVFFTVISSIYVVQGAIIIEELKEEDVNTEKWVLARHMRILTFFMFLFLGFLFAFSFWTIVLPQGLVSETFGLQESAVQQIRQITGDSVNPGTFSPILLNNLRVLVISLVLAFFYGAGAIFILVWNASVMGFVIGNLGRNLVGLTSLPIIFTKFFLHGIPEMLAYFVAALAGGIVFTAIVRGDFKSGRTKRLIIDFSVVLLISVILLVAAAFIEVYISSLI